MCGGGGGRAVPPPKERVAGYGLSTQQCVQARGRALLLTKAGGCLLAGGLARGGAFPPAGFDAISLWMRAAAGRAGRAGEPELRSNRDCKYVRKFLTPPGNSIARCQSE